MLYPKNIEQKLGFDKIRENIANECVSLLGRSFVDKVRFSDNFEQVKKLIDQTAEFRLIIQLENSFPTQNYLDVSDSLKRAAIPGTFLDEEQFYDIKLSLTTIQKIIHFFKNKEDEIYPNLKALSKNSIPESNPEGWGWLISEIDRIIDERGKVRDNASPELYEIRRKLAAEQQSVRRSLERIFRTARNSGWIGDEMSLTVRNGRLVIPVLAEHKRKLGGFVHDESSTGQMAFVEPAEVLEANNEIRDLEIRERREVIKILEKLTAFIQPHVPELQKAYFFLGLMDFIRAKAKFGEKIEATSPLLVDEQLIDWTRAKHPLLYLAHKKLNKGITPLNVRLDNENRILIVSGPNAGGKSVMLKTIGLIQYMTQCGLLVPVSPDSKIGIFRNLFIDIGDEQSIENDLSTYSSHLTNMKQFLNFSNRQTLFLIDEFGTGTEPTLGGAIAESILEQLQKSKALGVINTHYTNLKVFADKNPGLINGAMKFDGENLEALYELEMGKPGSSFALEVAQKIGLPDFVIKNAKKKLGSQQVDFEKLLKELEIEKKVFSERNLEYAVENQKLKQKIEQYNGLKDFLDTEKKRIINEAKDQAKNILKETNKKIENTIREIKENKAEKELTKIIREELVSFEKTELKAEKPKPEKVKKEEEWKKSEGEIDKGSFVKIKGQATIGHVLAMKGKDVEVAIGELKTTIKLNRLEKVSKKEYKDAVKESPKANLAGLDMNEKMSNFSFNLDIRGRRGEEALGLVDDLMDDAILLGYPEVRIVHGKGDGILRNLIRTHLKTYKQVGKMTDEHADRGGPGVTIVEMK
jgi:DNA mismatch repair protein MutS2